MIYEKANGKLKERSEFPVSSNASVEGLESVTLRAGGTDFNRSMFADALAQSLIADEMEVTTLADESNYEYVCDRSDLDSYIDYYVAEIYFGNNDWPGNNYRIWRADQKDSEYGDNKWRPVLFDVDEAFRFTAFNSVEYILTEDYDKDKLDDDYSRGFDDNREIIDALMKNPEFMERFFDRFEECLNTVFSEDNVLAAIERYEDLYGPEMEEQFARWHTTDGWLTKVKIKLGKGYTEKGRYSVDTWEKTVEGFKTFAKERPTNIRRYIAQYKEN
ncbi:CotH kinase family protein [Butyrivibrio sp. DSM 10294]|uniref:CotH kinase family protein n=1 Tax=Butyrivibrio sp. DSM 10294 TaxID=2972457 RepID=UPI00234E5924|nr:CotH kinase family protein [Butyrivibrio sp. DSM 10294]MDC7294807.1 CotH kinase family protein [Butyrivibrio sp. DSM 10294]